MQQGDVLFYRSAGTLLERLIEWRTHGPFVHCEIAWTNGTAIGAQSQTGVTQHAMLPPAAVWSPASHWNSQGMHDAFAFLTAAVQGHDTYGYFDLLDDALPGWWPIILEGAHAFDCSHLAAQYLIWGGLADLLGPLADRPALVTPNALARALGVLPTSTEPSTQALRRAA